MAGNIPETQSEKCGATCVMQQFKVVTQIEFFFSTNANKVQILSYMLLN